MRKGSKLGRPQRSHGLTGTSEYDVFRAMEARVREGVGCYASVTIEPAWVADPRLFVEHIGTRPTPMHEIDRIDGTKGYEPGNVRWATRAEQMRNIRTNVWVEAHGRRMVVTDWARELGIAPETIKYRLFVLKQPPDVACRAERQAGGRPPVEVTILGVTYPRIKDAAKAHGLKYHTLYMRLARGETDADLVRRVA